MRRPQPLPSDPHADQAGENAAKAEPTWEVREVGPPPAAPTAADAPTPGDAEDAHPAGTAPRSRTADDPSVTSGAHPSPLGDDAAPGADSDAATLDLSGVASDGRPDRPISPLSSDERGTPPVAERDVTSAVAVEHGGADHAHGADGGYAEQSHSDDERVTAREVWAAARARRKALRSEVRRFTARQRRRRRAWLITIGAVLLLVLGSVAAAYSPLFAVRQIEVVGAETLDAAEVAEALGGQVGTPLPLVDSSEVKAALVAFPLVESYTLEARPPSDLVVRIVERTPIGSIESSAGYTLVDAAGVALSTSGEAAEGYPVIDVRGGVDSDAFEAVGTVFRSLPEDLRSGVTELTATGANDVSFVLGETGTTVVWGSADESAQKSEVLVAMMSAVPPDEANSYDVSSPSAVVVG